MAGKLKASQLAKLRFLLCAHDLTACFFIGNTVRVGTGFCVLAQVFEVFRHAVIEKGQTVIEQRSRGKKFACMIVPQHTEVAEMSVFIVNQRIKDKYTAKLIIESITQIPVIIEA